MPIRSDWLVSGGWSDCHVWRAGRKFDRKCVDLHIGMPNGCVRHLLADCVAAVPPVEYEPQNEYHRGRKASCLVKSIVKQSLNTI